MTTPATSFAAWSASWLRGESAPDDVVDALLRWAPVHIVFAQDAVSAGRTGLPYPEPADTGVTALLHAVRRATADRPDAEVVLVLPTTGDVRGLPAGTRFAAAALGAGSGVLVGPPGEPGVGIVAAAEGQDVLRWTVHDVPEIPLAQDTSTLGAAEYAMREAVRSAATAVAELSVVTHSPDTARRAVAAALTEASLHTWPASLPPRAQRILDSADHVDAILTAADGVTGAQGVDGASARGLEHQLRPLRTAVRTARTAAINASARTRRPAPPA
ncbi:hypothetical protein DW322_14040 [Rhodococcus rhodnii]|uniref:Uncharacterized protein n=2 Tax=Rhodococcus rhodnii TaxID=38312 RepID=R7WLX5_9NOCA|nr:hypothetical protein [Rhodococcus rhodnii]EOM75029.1 hypothetical protein Rrhod_3642 [Rhodococcus rhodnii LMG 5362]TXG91133.1 hypothetical protein DW322_14040 [Rhodococcus rhodnii]